MSIKALPILFNWDESELHLRVYLFTGKDGK